MTKKELGYNLDRNGVFVHMYFDVYEMDKIDDELIEEFKENFQSYVDGTMVNDYILTFIDYYESEKEFLELIEYIEKTLEVELYIGKIERFLPGYNLEVDTSSNFPSYMLIDNSDTDNLPAEDYFIDSFLDEMEFPKLNDVEFELQYNEIDSLVKNLREAFDKDAVILYNKY